MRVGHRALARVREREPIEVNAARYTESADKAIRAENVGQRDRCDPRPDTIGERLSVDKRSDGQRLFDFGDFVAGHGEVRLGLVEDEIDEEAVLGRRRTDDMVLGVEGDQDVLDAALDA